MLFSNFNDVKGYFKGKKGPIWTFVIYLGQYLRNSACCDQCLYEAHTVLLEYFTKIKFYEFVILDILQLFNLRFYLCSTQE